MSSAVHVSFNTRSEIHFSSVCRFVQAVQSGGRIASWLTMKKLRCRLFTFCRATKSSARLLRLANRQHASRGPIASPVKTRGAELTTPTGGTIAAIIVRWFVALVTSF